MRIEIDIPKEFEEHFKQDKFKDSFERIMASIKHSLEDGNYVYGTKYEYETIEMLKKAFEDSKSAYDVDKVVDVQTKEIKWISVEDRLPDDGDSRFYMCLVENHLEEPPMYCQYEEEYGFGFWNDIYDSVTLGFVDSEFHTMEELHYEKVRYWMPLIEPPKDEEGARNEIDNAIEIVKQMEKMKRKKINIMGHNSIEEQKQSAKNTNELLNYLIEIIEQNNKRFSFEWAVGGEHATMEIFDNEKEIGYVVNIEPIKYDETGKAINV